MSWSAVMHAESRMCALRVVERLERREAKRINACASQLPQLAQFAGHFRPPPSPTRLRESALLGSVLSAAVTNHPKRFTFDGVIAECVKTVFAP